MQNIIHPRVPDPDLRNERVKMYADLTGNRKKCRIKSLHDNNDVRRPSYL